MGCHQRACGYWLFGCAAETIAPVAPWAASAATGGAASSTNDASLSSRYRRLELWKQSGSWTTELLLKRGRALHRLSMSTDARPGPALIFHGN